jgi:hypothetical protein
LKNNVIIFFCQNFNFNSSNFRQNRIFWQKYFKILTSIQGRRR